jgi:hypothetical protein
VSFSSSAGFVFPFWSFAVLCVFEDLIYVWSSNFFGLGFVCLFVCFVGDGRKVRDVVRSAFLLAVLLGMRRRRRSLESLERVSGEEEEGSREEGGGGRRIAVDTANKRKNGDFWMRCLPQFVGSGLCLTICTVPRL